MFGFEMITSVLNPADKTASVTFVAMHREKKMEYML
jgi:hypothetical protein